MMSSDEDISGSDGASPSVIAPPRPSFLGESLPAPGAVLLSSEANTGGTGPIDARSPSIDASGSTCSAKAYYQKNGCCLKVLVAMCHGALVGNKPLIDMLESPWITFPVSQICPNREIYAKEIERHSEQQSHASGDAASIKAGPRPKAWALAKIQEWLKQHPIVDPHELAFLRTTVEERKKIADEARKEEADENAQLGSGNWNSTACFRLIHTLIDFDDIKQQFLKRMNLPPGRSSVENREQLRASSVWQKMADKWNDKSFAPETVAMPDVYTEFSFSDIILHSEVAHLHLHQQRR